MIQAYHKKRKNKTTAKITFYIVATGIRPKLNLVSKVLRNLIPLHQLMVTAKTKKQKNKKDEVETIQGEKKD